MGSGNNLQHPAVLRVLDSLNRSHTMCIRKMEPLWIDKSYSAKVMRALRDVEFYAGDLGLCGEKLYVFCGEDWFPITADDRENHRIDYS